MLYNVAIASKEIEMDAKDKLHENVREAKLNIAVILARLAYLENLDNPNWSHTGDAGHLNELMAEAAAFASGADRAAV